MLRRPSPPIFILLLLLLCGGLVALYNAGRRQGGISAPESAAFIMLRPVQRALLGTGRWFSDVGRVMFRRNSILRENEALQGRVADLEGQTQRLQRYRLENDQMRKLLKMPPPPGSRNITADVVSLDSTDYTRSLLLNVGSRQGVRDKDVVFAAQGVVGQVVATSGTVPIDSCSVLLLTDRKAGVGAMTARTMARGIVQGTGERICKMSYLDYRADVREGDLVLTSGQPSIFPKGLVIGHVLKVERDKRYSRLTAYVDPAVPFDRLSAVRVLVRP